MPFACASAITTDCFRATFWHYVAERQPRCIQIVMPNCCHFVTTSRIASVITGVKTHALLQLCYHADVTFRAVLISAQASMVCVMTLIFLNFHSFSEKSTKLVLVIYSWNFETKRSQIYEVNNYEKTQASHDIIIISNSKYRWNSKLNQWLSRFLVFVWYSK